MERNYILIKGNIWKDKTSALKKISKQKAKVLISMLKWFYGTRRTKFSELRFGRQDSIRSTTSKSIQHQLQPENENFTTVVVGPSKASRTNAPTTQLKGVVINKPFDRQSFQLTL
ncbi:hypothetical protein Fot_06503 [Forsythia ovata]|uniref:Uncharacterized protein n=1 Tax=Forsythia ovata TaxID=205694 RepID=A0ABD1WT47_9LAMI